MNIRRQHRRSASLAALLALAIGLLGGGSVAVAGRPAQRPQIGPGGMGAGYPPFDSGYHDLAELEAELHQVAADHPDLVRLSSIGRSYQGRTIHLVKISDRPGVDEDEPEVLFDATHHAREHLPVEMSLSVIHLLTDGYASDPRIRGLVNSREIWIVPLLNPDGFVWDLGGEPYRDWRKNRQPNGAGEPLGTDLNRNYGHRWGGRGASANPGSDIYRGAAPFSSPETAAMRDFILSRSLGSEQQIKAHISFHTAGEYVLYPYGYTLKPIPADMTELDHRTFVAMAQQMAATNGYRARQSADWYIHSGTMIDWTYGAQRIFSFTFELHPSAAEDSGESRFTPPDEVIEAETELNHEAVLMLLESADCPYRAIGREARYCGPIFDDVEIDRGWKVNPAGTDTAASGTWERGRPSPTDRDGAKQLSAFSGRGAFVTGLAGGGCAACNDLDGGLTTLRSPLIELPSGAPATLRLRSYLSHGPGSGPEEGLRVAVIAGGVRTEIARILGTPADRDAAWANLTADLSRWAGSTVRLQFEAIDGGRENLLEAGIDEVRVTSH